MILEPESMSNAPEIAIFLERYASHPYGIYIEYYGRRCVAICAEANHLIPNTYLEVLDNQDIFYIVRPLA